MFTKIQWRILRDVFEAGGKLSPYHFLVKYGYTPKIILEHADDLRNAELISLDEFSISLTIAGRIKIYELMPKMPIMQAGQKRVVPEIFQGQSLSVYCPYIPSIRLLGREFGFKKGKKGEGEDNQARTME